MSGAARRLDHGPARGPRNMAVDEALMEHARAGGVALRFYRWDPPCLSFGRNQASRGRWNAGAARRSGIDVVRRPTGGRAVFHHRELTYAVVAPAGRWGGLRESYRRVNRALAAGLAELGADVGEAADRSSERAPGPGGRACFRDPLPGELVAAGRKLVGSAQWRDRGALLQHGSLLLHDDQARVDELRSDTPSASGAAAAAPESPAPAAAASPSDDGGEGARPAADVDEGSGASALAELLPDLPSPERLADALARGFAEEFGVEVAPSELAPSERRRAAGLEDRYRDDEWTWRR